MTRRLSTQNILNGRRCFATLRPLYQERLCSHPNQRAKERGIQDGEIQLDEVSDIPRTINNASFGSTRPSRTKETPREKGAVRSSEVSKKSPKKSKNVQKEVSSSVEEEIKVEQSGSKLASGLASDLSS